MKSIHKPAFTSIQHQWEDVYLDGMLLFFIINKWLVSQQKQANIKPAKNTTFELKSNFPIKLLKYAIQIYQY